MSLIINYNLDAVPTVKAFLRSTKPYKLIIGPAGGGKSSGCVFHLFQTMCQQKPNSQGIRRTRYAIVRNTSKELHDTTKKTIDFWLPSNLYVWKEAKMKYEFRFALEDGTIVESEWLLRALDNPDQVRDLLSLEITGAWLNEGKEILYDIFKMLRSRIGRFPSKIDGGPTYSYIIIDSNPSDMEHWLYKFFVEWPESDEKLRSMVDLFKQPSGRSPQAENLQNLPDGYYENMMVGQDEDFIRVYVDGEWGLVKTGKPVFPSYRDSIHCVDELNPKRGLPIYVGMDFGLYPACVFTQYLPHGQVIVFDEIVSTDPRDLEQFIKDSFLPKLNTYYYGFEVVVVGDPAGSARSQVDSRTCYSLLREYNIKAYPAYTNSLHDRIMAVNLYLTRFIGGEPAFLISKNCSFLRKGLVSEYKFRRLRVAGEKYSDVPEKNIYSHVCEALQYALLGYMPNFRRDEVRTGYSASRLKSGRRYTYESFV